MILAMILMRGVTPVQAQGSFVNPTCGGPTLVNGRTTWCSVVNVGGQLAPAYFTGCGLGQQCWLGDAYTGCSAINTSSCDAATYDTANCQGTVGEPIDGLSAAWTPNVCAAAQGCYIAHPQLSGGGICVPPLVSEEFDCANRSEVSCSAIDYPVCFDTAEDAGFILSELGTITRMLSYCDCVEGRGNDAPSAVDRFICVFESEDSHQAALDELAFDQEPFSDDKCPVCPDGYTAVSFEKVCRDENGAVPPTSFTSCGSGQYCDLGGEGGCLSEVNGCRINGLAGDVNDECAAPRATTCTIGSSEYCCPAESNCTGAGGEPTECIAITDVTAALGDCNELYTGYQYNCQVPKLGSVDKFCCTKVSVCVERGGLVPGVGFPFGGYCNGTTILGIDTALGCIPIDSPFNTSRTFVIIGIGMAGGVAFILIVLSGFFISTSQGDPRRLQFGWALFFSAVSGLGLLIFAGFLMRFVGVDILGLF